MTILAIFKIKWLFPILLVIPREAKDRHIGMQTYKIYNKQGANDILRNVQTNKGWPQSDTCINNVIKQ